MEVSDDYHERNNVQWTTEEASTLKTAAKKGGTRRAKTIIEVAKKIANRVSQTQDPLVPIPVRPGDILTNITFDGGYNVLQLAARWAPDCEAITGP